MIDTPFGKGVWVTANDDSGSVPLHPSGRQVELTYGGHRAVVVEVGGGLRSYTVEGQAVLDGYGPTEMCSSARGQTLVPWPNRLDGGTYEFEDERHQLPITEPEKNTAIHGLTRFANWEIGEHGDTHAAFAHRLHPQPGYPFLLDLTIDYRLDGGGLSVTTTARNVGDRTCPYGAGAHPYITVDGGPIDDLVLTSPAIEVLTADDRGIPTGRAPIDGTVGDFRQPRAIGTTRLDTAFTGLRRSADGLATISIKSPRDERQVDLWMDVTYPYLMLFTGDTVASERRRRGLGVEPMTCAPNAFRSGDGLISLEPNAVVTSTWGVRPTGFG